MKPMSAVEIIRYALLPNGVFGSRVLNRSMGLTHSSFWQAKH